MITEAHKAVVFDLDDTLVNTIGPKWQSHKEAARIYSGLELTDDDLRRVWGKPFQKMVCELYQTEDFEGVLKIIQSQREKYPKVAHPGSVELLQNLRERGILVGMVTSMSREGVEYDFSHLPFNADAFDFVQTEDESAFHKPDPRVFEPVLHRLGESGLSHVDVVYVGDHLFDFQAASGAQLDFIGVATGLVTIDQFHDAGANAVTSVAELLAA